MIQTQLRKRNSSVGRDGGEEEKRVCVCDERRMKKMWRQIYQTRTKMASNINQRGLTKSEKWRSEKQLMNYSWSNRTNSNSKRRESKLG